MILVTGASGPFGNAVVTSLLKNTPASNIAVLVRDPAKVETFKVLGVEIRVGDYSNYDSLMKAFTGIDQLLFVSGNDIANRTPQQANVVKAAKEAGVKQVVYTSFQRKNETGSSPIAFVAKAHLETEEGLKASGMTYTILSNTIYMDMLPIFIGDKVLETGTIFLPAGEGKVAYALRTDMAEAAANILTTKGHENKSYEISGNKAWSYDEIAEVISEVSGKLVRYVSPTQEVFHAEMSKAGVPDQYIGLFASFSEAARQGEFDQTDPTLEKLLGRKPVSLREYLQQVYAASTGIPA